MDAVTTLKGKIGRDRILIFLHISKAAGSTLHNILEKQYEDTGHFFTAGGPENKDRERILQLSSKEKERLGVVRGHVNYGVHELLTKPSVYITMLRDPIDRIISLYYYLKRDQNHYLHRRCISENWTLEDYILKTTENDNGQTRALAGALDVYSFYNGERPFIPFGECTDELREKAIKNLRQFLVVGLAERFDETLILLKRMLGWEFPPLFVKQNITHNRPQKDDIPETTIRLIEKYNTLDIELYRFVTELFTKQTQQQDISFKVEVTYFKMLNKSYQDHQTLIQKHQSLLQEHQRIQ